jgi:hypothetical protein
MPDQSKEKQEFAVLLLALIIQKLRLGQRVLPATISFRGRCQKARLLHLVCINHARVQCEERDFSKKSLALWRRLSVSCDGM